MKYECHITVEPLYDEELAKFKKLSALYGFRVANLLMVKGRADTPQRSNRDSFSTGHSNELEDIKNRMLILKNELIKSNIKVWRCKIEEIVFDERYEN